MSGPRLTPHDGAVTTAYPHMAGLLTLAVLAGLSAGLVRTTSSLFAVALQANATELGLVSASQSLGLVLMSLPSGMLVHRHGPARIFALASLGAGLAYLVMPLIPSIPVLIAASLVAGCGMPMRFVSTNLAVMQRIEYDQGRSAGWFRGCHLTSMFLIGPTIAVPVIAHGGYAVAWWVVSASFFVAMLAAPRILRGIRDKGDGRALTIAGILGLLTRDRDIRTLAQSEALAQGAMGAFCFFIIAVAMRDFACSAAAATALVGLQATVFILTFLLLGGRCRQWQRPRLLLAAFGGTVSSLLVIGLTRHAIGLWMGSVVLGVGMGLIQLDHLYRATALGERSGMSALAGIMSLAGSLGGLLAGLAGGAIGQLIGTQSLFTALVPLFAWVGWQQWSTARLHSGRTSAPAGDDTSVESTAPAVAVASP